MIRNMSGTFVLNSNWREIVAIVFFVKQQIVERRKVVARKKTNWKKKMIRVC